MDHGICRCQISPNSPCLPPRCSALLPSIPLRVKSKRIFRGGWDAFGLEGSNLTKHLFVLTQTSHPHLIASMRRKWTVQWRLLIAIAPTDVFPFICTFRYKMYNGIMTCRLPTWIYFAQVFSLFFSLWILKIFIFIFLFISKIIITQYCDSSKHSKDMNLNSLVRSRWPNITTGSDRVSWAWPRPTGWLLGRASNKSVTRSRGKDCRFGRVKYWVLWLTARW